MSAPDDLRTPKIVLAVTIGFFTLAFEALPYFLHYWLHRRNVAKLLDSLNFCCAVAAGVVFGAFLGHVLPDAIAAFTTYMAVAFPPDPVTGEQPRFATFDWASLCCGLSFVLLVTIDRGIVARGISGEGPPVDGHDHVSEVLQMMPLTPALMRAPSTASSSMDGAALPGCSSSSSSGEQEAAVCCSDDAGCAATDEESGRVGSPTILRSGGDIDRSGTNSHLLDTAPSPMNVVGTAHPLTAPEQVLQQRRTAVDAGNINGASVGGACPTPPSSASTANTCSSASTATTTCSTASAAAAGGHQWHGGLSKGNGVHHGAGLRKEDTDGAHHALVLAGPGSVAKAWTFMVALSLHGVFEGLAVGSTDDATTFWVLLIAMVVHKGFDGIALGVPLLLSGMPKGQGECCLH